MRLLALLLAVTSLTAHAWPSDLAVKVAPGDELFRRLSSVDWVDSADPSIARAEVLPSLELMITGVAEGTTHLLLYAEGRLAVWRVDVTEDTGSARARPLPAGLLAGAKEACPKFSFDPEDPELVAELQDEACRKAVLALLEEDLVLAGDLEVTYSLGALQSQHQALTKALEAEKLPVSARYLGAGLVLEGTLSSVAQRKRALWIAFRHSLGRVPLDDRTRVVAASDGGE